MAAWHNPQNKTDCFILLHDHKVQQKKESYDQANANNISRGKLQNSFILF